MIRITRECMLKYVRINSTGKSSAFKSRLDETLAKERAIVRRHFNREAAHNLDASLLISTILQETTGFDVWAYIEGKVMPKGTILESDGRSTMITSATQRVFYNTHKNRLYVDTEARDIDNDINLGRL